VTLVERDEQRWVVSPYGGVNWVKNARALGEVSLFRGGKTKKMKLKELPPEESAPILKENITKEGIVRSYFDVEPDATLKDFEAQAYKHPVFLLESKSN
jgi:hypothetical protein